MAEESLLHIGPIMMVIQSAGFNCARAAAIYSGASVCNANSPSSTGDVD